MNERLLLIENDDSLHNLILNWLTEAGFEVISTKQVDDGIYMLESYEGFIDAVWTNNWSSYGDSDGIDLVERYARTLPVFLVSGDSHLRGRVEAAGGFMIEKPFFPEDRLIALIREKIATFRKHDPSPDAPAPA